jgi:hypothetical protein
VGDSNGLTRMMRAQRWTLECVRSLLQQRYLGQGVRATLGGRGRDWEGAQSDREGHLEAWDFVALGEEDWLTAEGESGEGGQ